MVVKQLTHNILNKSTKQFFYSLITAKILNSLSDISAMYIVYFEIKCEKLITKFIGFFSF